MTRCGIMDQLASTLGRAGHALLIDCRDLETSPIPLACRWRWSSSTPGCDTGTRPANTTGGGPSARRRCAASRRVLFAVRALRDVTPAEFERHEEELPEPFRRRARHVVSEIDRARRGATALSAGAGFGRLMYDSHRSLRDDYEVSVPELDALVEAAAAAPGVLGARMTGGGFGGCVVSLVQASVVEPAAQAVAAGFARRFGWAPGWFVTRAADGAGEVDRRMRARALGTRAPG